jgi:uncharacterized Zn-binding protein involved in type VI secretion
MDKRLDGRFGMRARVMVSLAVFVSWSCAGLAQTGGAEPPDASMKVITEGSQNTTIGGLPAARAGDATDGGAAVIEGSPNVFINGRPAATVGDRTNCGGVVVGGASNVFINGKPVARAGDVGAGCPGQ